MDLGRVNPGWARNVEYKCGPLFFTRSLWCQTDFALARGRFKVELSYIHRHMIIRVEKLGRTPSVIKSLTANTGFNSMTTILDRARGAIYEKKSVT